MQDQPTGSEASESTATRGLERKLILVSRFLAGAAAIGSLGGAVLMFMLGLVNIVQAYGVLIVGHTPETPKVAPSTASMIMVIEALDRFLIAIVLLYFGYGVYSLFIRPESRDHDPALPSLLRVREIGQLKQVVAEVIIVVLFVLFLRNALEAFQGQRRTMDWQELATFLVLPVSAALLSLGLKLVELHPKPARPSRILATQVEPEPEAKAKQASE
ncbi:MAG: YqhA family protein [Hyphomicrobiaceae bacterium]